MHTLYPVVMAEKDIIYFQLRLPAELHERLKALRANDEDRSLHWEALRVFRRGLDEIEAEQQKAS